MGEIVAIASHEIGATRGTLAKEERRCARRYVCSLPPRQGKIGGRYQALFRAPASYLVDHSELISFLVSPTSIRIAGQSAFSFRRNAQLPASVGEPLHGRIHGDMTSPSFPTVTTVPTARGATFVYSAEIGSCN